MKISDDALYLKQQINLTRLLIAKLLKQTTSTKN